jgi:hypothetical protein
MSGMTIVGNEASIAAALSRYGDATLSDDAREKASGELGNALELLVCALIGADGDSELNPRSTDGISPWMIKAIGPAAFEIWARVWLLYRDGTQASEPLLARVRLTDDGLAVASYDLKSGDPAREICTRTEWQAMQPRPEPWSFHYVK